MLATLTLFGPWLIAEAATGNFVLDSNASGGDCTAFGNWDAGTHTCTQSEDVDGTITFVSPGLTLDGGGHSISGLLNSTLLIIPPGSDNATVRNCEIIHSSDQNAAVLVAADGVAVQTCRFEIEALPETGFFTPVSAVQVTGNSATISDGEFLIAAYGRAATSVGVLAGDFFAPSPPPNDLLIENSQFDLRGGSFTRAIRLQGSVNTLIRNNTFSALDVVELNFIQVLSANGPVTIDGNLFNFNDLVGRSRGVRMIGAFGTILIQANQFNFDTSQCEKDGLGVCIPYVVPKGIEVNFTVEELLAVENEFIGNANEQIGIHYLFGDGTLVAEENSFSDLLGGVIHSFMADQPPLVNARVSHNSFHLTGDFDSESMGFPILVEAGRNTGIFDYEIASNTFVDSLSDAITIRSIGGAVEGVTIDDNIIRDSAGNGISAVANRETNGDGYIANAMLSNNQITRSGQDGVRLEDADDTQIHNNRIEFTVGAGVRLLGSSTTKVFLNDVRKSMGIPVYSDTDIGLSYLMSGTTAVGNYWDSSKCNKNGLDADADGVIELHSPLLGDSNSQFVTDYVAYRRPVAMSNNIPKRKCVTDNCPGMSNASQSDADGDLVGDLCDSCPLIPNLNQNGAACSPVLTIDNVSGSLVVDVTLFDPSGDTLSGNLSISGPAEAPVSFSKPDFADWTVVNDCLTPGICLSRGDRGFLCNVAPGSLDVCTTIWEGGPFTPAGTEWAMANCAEASGFGTFSDLASPVGPPALVGEDLCVHLIADNLFYDFTLTSWSCCNQGGVSWTRVRNGNQLNQAWSPSLPASLPLTALGLIVGQSYTLRISAGNPNPKAPDVSAEAHFVHQGESAITFNQSGGPP